MSKIKPYLEKKIKEMGKNKPKSLVLSADETRKLRIEMPERKGKDIEIGGVLVCKEKPVEKEVETKLVKKKDKKNRK